MTRCENCDEEVPTVWKVHVRTDEMTHRRTRTVCADCHPFLSIAPGTGTGGALAATGGAERA